MMTVQNIENTTNNNWKLTLTSEERKKIKSNTLYKGRLSYIKDIILADCPDIDPGNLSEKLDIPITMAILLLEDCTKTDKWPPKKM